MLFSFHLYNFFSNNFSITFAGEAIGAEATLPYLSPQLNGQRLLVGANFASAGIGILNDTGIQFVRETQMFNILILRLIFL